jgi:hypothetical protein
MKLFIPEGTTPAAEVNRQERQWVCRPCSGPRPKVVLIRTGAHVCQSCGELITVPVHQAMEVSA